MVNLKDQRLGENVRKSFSRTRFNLELPNLVEIQTKSYKWFLEEGRGAFPRSNSKRLLHGRPGTWIGRTRSSR